MCMPGCEKLACFVHAQVKLHPRIGVYLLMTTSRHNAFTVLLNMELPQPLKVMSGLLCLSLQ